MQATIAVVRYESLGRKRLGVASTHVCERLSVGQAVPIYISKNPDFRRVAGRFSALLHAMCRAVQSGWLYWRAQWLGWQWRGHAQAEPPTQGTEPQAADAFAIQFACPRGPWPLDISSSPWMAHLTAAARHRPPPAGCPPSTRRQSSWLAQAPAWRPSDLSCRHAQGGCWLLLLLLLLPSLISHDPGWTPLGLWPGAPSAHSCRRALRGCLLSPFG